MPNERTAQVSTDPDEVLERRRGEAATVLASALLEVDASRRVVAAAVACGETRLAALADPEHDATLCVARASMLPAPAARRIAGWIAGDSCAVIELPVGDSPEIDFAAASRAHRSSGAAVQEALEGFADRHLDAAEGARLEAAADRAIRDLLALREIGRRAQRERGILIPIARAR